MYNTSTNYKNTVLEDSTKHVLKLYIGNRQLEPNHIFDFTINAEMFSDELYLGATPMKSCSFKIHKDEIQSGDKEIRVVSGIEGEEIPMGTFVFEDVKEVDFFTYEITAVDYMYKFEGAYDTDLDFSEGVTLLEVLNDLCEKSDVVLGSESFINDDTVIAVYDSTLQRKEYLSYIAEQAGGFAIIGRDNKLYINTFNHTENASELNLNNFKSFKWGQQTSISKIAYEDGIQNFKKGDDSGSTLWIAQKNMYITSQSQIDNIYDKLTETEREIEEEGTSITIEDSKEGTKIDYSIEGETSQSGTPTPDAPIEVKNVTGEQIVGFYTNNYLNLYDDILWRADSTITKTIIDNDNIEITYSGESATYKRLWQDNNLQIPDGTYSLSATATSSDAVVVGIGIDEYPHGSTTRHTWYEIWITPQAGASGTRPQRDDVIIDNSRYYYRLRFFLSQGTGTTNNTVHYKNIMLKKVGNPIEYEIYKGKKYNVNLGKNLIEVTRDTTTQGGLTFTINEDKSISVTGTFSSTVYFNVFSGRKEIQPNAIYTLSGAVSPSARLRIRLFDKEQTQLSEYYLQSKSGYTFTTPSNACYYDIYIVMYAVNEGDTFYPQLEKGDQATTYTQYFTPIELNKIGNSQDVLKKGTGKNLFDKDSVIAGYRFGSDGELYANEGCYATEFINVKPNTTYTTSWTIVWNMVVCLYDKDKHFTRRLLEGTNFTTTSEERYIRADVTGGYLETAQIEEGSTKTDYEPFGYKNKWYIEKNVGKVVLDSNCDVASFQAGTVSGISRFAVGVNDLNCIGIDEAGTNSQLYCNILSAINRDKTHAKVQGMCYGMATNTVYKNFLIYTDETQTYDVATFKTWLGTNKPIVYYIQKSTTYPLIENVELIKQLDELNNATLMEGTTNILVSGDPSFIMNLDFDVRNRNFYQFEGGSIVDPANDLGDVVIIDEKPVIFEGKMSYLGKWYIDVNSTALVKDKAHSMNTKTDTRAKIRRVESQINQIEGEITQVVEATEEISKDYVTNSEYTTYKTETTQNMNKLSRQVSRTVETLYGENDDGLVKRVEKTETDISQNAEDITLSVGRISSLETKTEEIDDNTQKIVKSFKFNDDGLTVSNQGSDEDDGANINIDNDDIKIRIGTATKLLINGSGIYYDSASFNKLDLGEFAIVAEENGYLSIIYEGGN